MEKTLSWKFYQLVSCPHFQKPDSQTPVEIIVMRLFYWQYSVQSVGQLLVGRCCYSSKQVRLQIDLDTNLGDRSRIASLLHVQKVSNTTPSTTGFMAVLSGSLC